MKFSHLEIYTVGHSTRSIDEFVSLLKAADIDFVVDVRTIPKSRTNPQYNKDVLPKSLKLFRIQYRQIPELGGLRGKNKNIDSRINAFWINQSFHNYADYALTEEFHKGLSKLIEIARSHRCAIMCSEAVWWRCHRRIITDYLLALGVRVYHLMGPEKIEFAKMTPESKVEGSQVVYPITSPERIHHASKLE